MDHAVLFEQLFKRNLSAADTNNFLTTLTKEHPYFTAAQFFLLQNTAEDNSTYKSQASKTALLFNNPFWLNYKLGELSFIEEIPVLTNEADEKNEADEVKEANDGYAVGQTIIEEIAVENRDRNEPEHNIAVALPSLQQPIFAEEEAGKQMPVIAIKTDNYEPKLPEEKSIIEKALIVIDSDNQIAADGKETTSATILPSTEIENNQSVKQPFIKEEFNYPTARGEMDYEENYEGELTDESEILPMNIKLDFTADMTTTEETISFEPLYTSDYFASLGIKFMGDAKSADKLGRQLKSFTEWLKTMKKINPEHLVASTEETDIIIQKMAETSNTETETVTEAMADVLLQQGKKRKAMEVYQKLSLQNPAKMAYFAAKIGDIES